MKRQKRKFKLYKQSVEKEMNIENSFDTQTRIVLIEKAPFLVKTTSVFFERIGHILKINKENKFNIPINKDAYFLVRPINKNEWNKSEQSLLITYAFLPSAFPKDFTIKEKTYIIIDYGASVSLKNSPSQIGCWIVDSDFEVILNNGEKIFNVLW